MLSNLSHLNLMARESLWFGFAFVKEASGTKVIVQWEGGCLTAEKAETCLLAPETGDRVLLVSAGPAETYILEVLKKGESPKKRLVFDQDTAIEVRGDLALMAKKLRLGAPEEVSVKTRNLDMACLNASARFDQASLTGRKAVWRLDTLRFFVDRLDTAARRIQESAKRVFRRIEEFEDTRAGRIRLWIKRHYTVQSGSASIKAKENLKMDGDKILLG